MSDAAATPVATRGRSDEARALPWWLDVPAIGGWTLGFTLVAVLGFSGGGYDAIVRGEVGIAAWWIVGAGMAVGALALPRSRWAFIGLALFLALTAWTTLALTWTASTERTVAEVARTVGYAGMLILVLAVCARAPVRHLLAGVASALAAICGYAVVTRLQPEWFGVIVLNEIFPAVQRRLSQPVGYWNALAGLAAVTLPLLMAFAGDARRLGVRACSASLVPVAMLVVMLTVSRGGVIAAAVALIVWLVLTPDRISKFALLSITGSGSAIVCVAAERRNAMQAGVDTALARQQGDELQTILLLVMAGVAAMTYGLALLERHASRPSFMSVSRRRSRVVGALSLGLAVGVLIVVGGPSWTQDRIDEFRGTKASAAQNFDNSFSRLRTVDSNGRYQYWVVARNAQREDPLTGVGPGTFEYLWARDGTLAGAGFVRDAHSLWAEALGELGLVGLVLVLSFFLLALGVGAMMALRARDAEHRAAMAAATAGLAGFCTIASLEWAWEMTVLGATGIALAGACLAGRGDGRLRSVRARTAGAVGETPRPARVQRVALGLAAVVAVVAIAIPTSTTARIRDSQDAARSGNLAAAYTDARVAAATQPYSAPALMQEALVLERAGELPRALASAVRATDAEPVNWRTWFIRSRLEARTGDAAAALGAYRRARSLNPNSALFDR